MESRDRTQLDEIPEDRTMQLDEIPEDRTTRLDEVQGGRSRLDEEQSDRTTRLDEVQSDRTRLEEGADSNDGGFESKRLSYEEAIRKAINIYCPKRFNISRNIHSN